jgi:hypothetical protein
VQAAGRLEGGLVAADPRRQREQRLDVDRGPGWHRHEARAQRVQVRAPAQPTGRGRGEVTLELRPVHDRARSERDVEHVGRVGAVGRRLAHGGDVHRGADHALARHEAQRQLAVVPGRSQRHRERAGIDADLERPFHGERVVPRLTRTAGHARDRPPDDRAVVRHATHTFTWGVRVANVPSASASSV